MCKTCSHILHIHVCLVNINIDKLWDLRSAKRLSLYLLLCGVFYPLIHNMFRVINRNFYLRHALVDYIWKI